MNASSCLTDLWDHEERKKKEAVKNHPLLLLLLLSILREIFCYIKCCCCSSYCQTRCLREKRANMMNEVRVSRIITLRDHTLYWYWTLQSTQVTLHGECSVAGAQIFILRLFYCPEIWYQIRIDPVFFDRRKKREREWEGGEEGMMTAAFSDIRCTKGCRRENEQKSEKNAVKIKGKMKKLLAKKQQQQHKRLGSTTVFLLLLFLSLFIPTSSNSIRFSSKQNLLMWLLLLLLLCCLGQTVTCYSLLRIYVRQWNISWHQLHVSHERKVGRLCGGRIFFLFFTSFSLHLFDFEERRKKERKRKKERDCRLCLMYDKELKCLEAAKICVCVKWKNKREREKLNEKAIEETKNLLLSHQVSWKDVKNLHKWNLMYVWIMFVSMRERTFKKKKNLTRGKEGG